MANSKVKTWLQLSSLLDRAQKAFEDKSGWNAMEVSKTLENFSRLNRLNQVLLGGLLVGHSLRRTVGDRKPRLKSSKKEAPKEESSTQAS